MANLSLYTVSAFFVADSEGNRVLAKYYPRPEGIVSEGPKHLTGLKEQRAFEKGLWEKTKKPGGDVILYDSYLALYKHHHDLIFYIIGPSTENELVLSAGFNAFSDALGLLLRNQIEKRSVLENLDAVLLCLDETIDDGIIFETDYTTIASRVSRPRTDTAELGINEQAITNALVNVRDRISKSLQQL